jgi:hypothetical protein
MTFPCACLGRAGPLGGRGRSRSSVVFLCSECRFPRVVMSMDCTCPWLRCLCAVESVGATGRYDCTHGFEGRLASCADG